MSAQDLTPMEMRAMKTKQVIFDGDNFPLVKLDGGWMYTPLVDSEGKTTQRLLPDPKAYPPYSVAKKADKK